MDAAAMKVVKARPMVQARRLQKSIAARVLADQAA